MHSMVSTTPDAPNVWPIYDLKLFIGLSVSPAKAIALLSISSLYTVEVPCAFIKPISFLSRFASLNALSIAEYNPSPVLDGPDI